MKSSIRSDFTRKSETNADLCQQFFADMGNDIWKCKYCENHTRKKSNGWSNLKTHVTDAHKDYLEIMKEANLTKNNSNSSVIVGPYDRFLKPRHPIVSSDARNYFSWIEWVVQNNESQCMLKMRM